MEITILRYRVKNNTIDGKLFINDQEVCDTTESRSHQLATGTYQIKLKDCPHLKRSIPILCKAEDTDGLPGSIHTPCEQCVKVHQAHEEAQMAIYTPIDNVIQEGKKNHIAEEEYTRQARLVEASLPDRAKSMPLPVCAQIKVGNSNAHATDNSILVGRFLQPGIVTRSREVFDQLFDRLRKSTDRGHQVSLIIKEAYRYQD